jgi:RNA polymerase sporulation-specific sigma factor
MAGYKVEICGVNTAKLPLLTNDEKEALFARILEGDQEAREQYIKGNLRLVLSVIQRFSGSQENVDDLFQIGCIGLIKAIDNFDVSQQVKFSTYAVPMILLSREKINLTICMLSHRLSNVHNYNLYCISI